MTTPVKLGLIQTKVSADFHANIRKTTLLAEKALIRGAKIVCLQELYAAPYFPQRKNSNTAPYLEVLKGPSYQAFAPLAKKYKAVIIVPIFEKGSGGNHHNTALVIDPSGKVQAPYRKMHIPQDPGFYEKNYFEEGPDNGYRVYPTPFGTIGVLICFDQWFPEAARAVKLKGADIIFYPTAIGDLIGLKIPNDQGAWHEAWELTQRSHAIDNSVVVCAVNRLGTEGGLKFWGQSFVSGPFGKILARASKTKEEVLVVEVDLTLNKYVSDEWGFMHNRRPNSYKSLVTEDRKRTKKLRPSPYTQEAKRLLRKKI